ncbi:MAG: glycosyltransferase family 2 protein [Clostridium sp.]|nr:glycosyltransferase family 2 protein [Acetatifactor muris]MCM1527831.1 glycosyltransferase family 2 protein [Bacteroides sp.]MCM1563510.1 glycosyltransferase family 2 protein [Clostridium sp.]
MKASKITVVIPNYNGIRYLKDCLETLYAQEPGTPAFDVTVVDNGSADGSPEMAERFFPDTRMIRLSENTGFCHAVNVGIRESGSPYIILLNNDTKVRPGFVKALYEAIRRDGRIFSVSAKMLMWDRPGLVDDAGDRYNALGWAYARGKGRPAGEYDRAVPVFSACGGAAIYRRNVLERLGLFDELHFAYLEDLDLGYRARLHGYRNLYAPGAEVVHFGSASTGSRYNARKTGLAAANNIYVIYKNMPTLQILWNLPFLVTGFAVKWLFFVRKGMGILYLQGLAEGVRRCASPEGRARKVPFRRKNLTNYLKIQWELYVNLIRFFFKN